MKVNDPHLAVVFGGPSSEHEVSLMSGAAVADALEESFSRVDRVRVEGHSLDLDTAVEAVFVAIHGAFGEDGQLQAILDARGVPYVGSGAEACRRTIDKVETKRALRDAGHPVLEDWVVDSVEGVPGDLPFPAVIKPAAGGSSIGVRIVRRSDEVAAAVEAALEESPLVLIEPYFAGREFTVSILGDRALPIVEVCPGAEFYDYRVKYTPGCTEYRVPAPLPEGVTRRLQRIGEEAHRLLGCRHLSRVDFLYREETDRVALLEINTIPGFTPTSLFPKAARAAGIPFPRLCRDLVWMALDQSSDQER